MLSKNRLKFLKSLQNKKYRKEYQCFLVEGEKNMLEVLNSSSTIHSIYCRNSFFEDNRDEIIRKGAEYFLLKEEDISSITTLINNHTGLLVLPTKENKMLIPENNEYILVLDTIQDPGNMGTIIRVADWYGIKKIICSEDTVELYNPKVIASTMGSFLRVELYYCNLEAYLKEYHQSKTVYGAFIKGENLHHLQFSKDGGFVIMGNESKGICRELISLIHHPVAIPSFGGGAESLNVAMAAAIICDNMKRQTA